MLELPKKILGLQWKVARAVASAVTGAGRTDEAPANPLRREGEPTPGVSSSPSARDHHSYDPVAPATRPAAGARTVRVHFETGNIVADVAPGTTLLEAALSHRIDLNHYCGGMASCGSCRVEIVDGQDAVSTMEPMEEPTLDMVKENPGDRLGCQTRVHGPLVVRIPPQD